MTSICPPQAAIKIRDQQSEGARPLSAQAERLAARLASEPLSVAEIDDKLGADFQEHAALQELWGAKRLELVDNPKAPSISAWSAAPSLSLHLGLFDSEARWSLSRFAIFRLDEDSGQRPVVESARTGGRARVLRPEAAVALWELSRPCTSEMLGQKVPALKDQTSDFLFALRAAGLVVNADLGDEEREDPTLGPWELHDLWFHSRSRLGRNESPLGATFRFRGKLPAQPALKANKWLAQSVHLPPVDVTALATNDLPFTAVLENRRSIRVPSPPSSPIDIARLGEFLFRSARVRSVFPTEVGELSSRPYPSGGASYELEIYVAVNACRDLERGLYYYDPLRHVLSHVASPSDDFDALLHDAWISSAQQYVPQLLITISSRFQRVTWKYAGMGYATQLKNVGALLQTMYLVATAMGLAPCALGLGDAERFAKLSGLDYLSEGSVGEFLLGTFSP